MDEITEDDINLEKYKESEETDEPSGNGKEEQQAEAKQTRSKNEPTGEPVIQNDQLTAIAKRLGGFGMSGQAREAFEDEFAGLADLISNIFGIEEASKIVSLKTSMKPKTRLIGGVIAITFVSGFWRFIIDRDSKAGGQIKSTIDQTSQSSQNQQTSPGSGKSQNNNTSTKNDQDGGFTFGDKKDEREKEETDTEETDTEETSGEVE